MKDDTIYRQAAIDALHTWFRDGFDKDRWWNSTHVLAAIEGLPSAQSEYTEQDVRDSFNSGYACGMEAAQPEIIRCKDCRYWVAHDKRCVYLNHGFAPNMWCCHAERRTDG